MTFWFLALGIPLFGYGLFTVLKPDSAARFLQVFPRHKMAGWILCAVAWAWTAYEIDTIGIEVFDRIVRRLWFFQSDIPGMVWILAVLLTVLTCLWMENLLTIRAMCAIFMLFPAELFPAVRLCESAWRLTLVVFAYVCAVIGMVGMFYPWHIRRALAWRAESRKRVVGFGIGYLAIGALFLALCAFTSARAAEVDDRFPFVVSYGGADNASSVAHLLDAPAGKHGFVRVEGNEFVTDAGPIRFNGTNLTGPANFPEHDVADRLAARFARLGINCVRLHFMDTWYKNFMDRPRQCILDDDSKTQRKLSPAQLDKFDYLIAAFKKRGIYVNMNLHVGRTLDERDGVPKGSPWANKTVGQFYPRCIELQKEYAHDLLTHVNKYTGNAYTDEPAVAMIEISNEDRGLVVTRRHMGIKKLAKPYQDELERQWNEWLKKKYHSGKGGPRSVAAAYANGKAPLLNKFPKASAQFRKDFDDFLWDNELAYWKGMRDYIRETLKAKSPVSGTQAGSHYSPREIQAQLDYVDAHAYFHHPSGKGRGWIVKNSTNEWVAGGESLVHGLSTLTNLEFKSHAPSKPFTVSEYSHPYPSPFTGEGQPLACAYGRTMGWDGIFQYSYNHFPEAFEPEGMPWCIFDAIATPSVWVHSPVCAAMLVRGDLRADRARKLGEFIWNRDRPGKEYVAVNTKNSKLFVGYADGRDIALGGVSLKVGSTKTGAAVVSLVSRNATGFGENGKASILMAASGVAANSDAKIERVSKKLVRLPARGHAPVCAEGISCELTIPAPPSRVKCWALAGDGSRKQLLEPAAVGDGSRSLVKLAPAFRTLWYEVAVD